MRIALAGAPGAGKSDVARELARLLEAQGGRYLPVAIVGQVHGWWVPEWQLPYAPA